MNRIPTHPTPWVLTWICFLILSCNSFRDTSPQIKRISSEFSAYIESHTTGVISNRDRISIDFSEEMNTSVDPNEGLSIESSPDGSWKWVDENRVVFETTEDFKPGQTYTVSIDLSTFYPAVSAELSQARFNIAIMKPDFALRKDGLQFMPDDPSFFQTTFSLQMADHVTDGNAEKMFRIEDDRNSLQLTWNHINSRLHEVTVSGIERLDQAYEIKYHVMGQPISIQKSKSDVLKIPAHEDFKVLEVRTDPQTSNHVEIVFSDALNQAQSIDGLVEIEDIEDYSFEVDQNRLHIFSSTKLLGTKQLKILESVENKLGENLRTAYVGTVSFESIPPAVKFARGSILPSSNGTSILFESMNLRAVDVAIHRIYSDNVPQFYQESTLSNSANIHRVGKRVVYRTLSLEDDQPIEQNRWVRHHINLHELLETKSGAIYQVELGFRKSMSIFPCREIDSNYVSLTSQSTGWSKDPLPNNDNYWQSYYPVGYEWGRRDDPCNVSYYTGDRKVSKNIFVSDLGLLAKVGDDRLVHIVTTNLLSARPESDVKVDLLDYQLQPVGKAKTNGQGMIIIETETRPFLAVATKGMHCAYLRLDDGQALTMSHFNIAGDQIKDGLKAFIYGERGVWRPGDDLFISCMIDDSHLPLPDAYPLKFSLKDPQGTLVDEQVEALNASRHHTFHSKTSVDALTGNWLVEISVGNRVFTKKIKIETIKPNRLRVELDLDGKTIPSTETKVTGNMNVFWLTGVPGREIKSEYEVYLRESNQAFPGFEQFVFRDNSREISSREISQFSTISKADGNAPFSFDLPNVEEPTGRLQLVLNGKIFEPSGNFSTDYRLVDYSPYKYYVGINLPKKNNQKYYEANSTINVQSVTLSESGQPISRNQLTYSLYKLSWRWWWDQLNGRANYVGSQIQELVKEGVFKSSNGKATIPLQTPRQGGRYYLQVCDEESGHCTGQELYVSWSESEGQKDDLGANVLNLSTDLKDYDVGDQIELRIPSQRNALALVSIENGSGIIHKEWISLEDEQTVYRTIASSAMSPNVYFHVTLLQPHDQTSNDRPMRLYGVVPIRVQDPMSILDPIIDMPDQLEPEKEYTIQISEASGLPMSYTLAIVDEGLLNITNYSTPNPWQHFNAKEALGVKTWDLYDHVIGAYGGKIERLLTIGGDGDAEESNNNRLSRFEPVVTFLGPFQIKGGSKNEHTIKMPNYVGSVKTMVIARNNGQYGHSEKQIPVKKPLMVLGTLPRILGPREECKLPVSVFALENAIQEVEVSIQTEGNISVNGAALKSTQFTSPGEKTIDFAINTDTKAGRGKVLIHAKSGSFCSKACHRIECENGQSIRNRSGGEGFASQ